MAARLGQQARKVRDFLARHRTSRAAVFLGVATLLLLPIGYAQTTGAVASAEQQSSIVDLQSLMSDRSPGPRGPGWLTQSKLALTPATRPPAIDSNREVVSGLGSLVGEDNPLAEFAELSPSLTPPLDVGPEPVGGFAPPSGGGFEDGPAAGPLFGPNPGLGSGAGFGPGESLPGTGPGPGLDLPLPPTGGGTVPEPDAWLTMIIGLFLTGSVLRRRQTREASRRHGNASGYRTGIGD